MVHQIAIIPARGGSKRLPRKNILPVHGRPMISYPIQSALSSRLFDMVLVSTEDDEIAEIAAFWGAHVIRRPEKLATDRSSVVEVCAHVLSLDSLKGIDRFCCIYPTAVLLDSQEILASSSKLDGNDADYVMGVSSYNYHPVQALRDEKGYLTSMWPEYQAKKSQDYPQLVVSNGTLYWAKVVAFQRDLTFYGPRLVGHLLEAIDVDTQEDYQALLAHPRWLAYRE